jgi:hypothetical protein
MPPPRWPSTETLRYAARRAVARSSLRKVAGEMGMAVSWLNSFVEGKETALRTQTKRHLREWFVRHAAELAEHDADTAGAALSFLVGGLLTGAERRETFGRLVHVLARAYSDAGPLPPWLRELLDDETRAALGD